MQSRMVKEVIEDQVGPEGMKGWVKCGNKYFHESLAQKVKGSGQTQNPKLRKP